jgi:hypothetical protein
MAEFLKRTLIPLAKRVRMIPSNYCENFDQWMTVRYSAVTKGPGSPGMDQSDPLEAVDHVDGYLKGLLDACWYKFPPNFGFREALHTLCGDETFIRHQDKIDNATDNDDITGVEQQIMLSRMKRKQFQYWFDNTVCQVSCKLLVSSLPIEMSLHTQVRMAVVFGALSPLVYPLPDVLTHNQVATHVILYCYPLYAKQTIGVDVAPKVIVLSANVVDAVMSQDDRLRQMSSDRVTPKALHGSSTSHRCHSGAVDVALEVGGHMLERVLRTIVSRLKFESTKSGVQLNFAGASNSVFTTMYSRSCGLDPDIIPWPDPDAVTAYANRFSRAASVYYPSGPKERSESGSDSEADGVEKPENIGTSQPMWKHTSAMSAEAGYLKSSDGISAHIRPFLNLVHNDAIEHPTQQPLTSRATPSPSIFTARDMDSKVSMLAPSKAPGSEPQTSRLESMYPLSTRQFVKGTVLSLYGKFQPLTAASSGNGEELELVVVVHANGFTQVGLTLESMYVEYFLGTLDPPHEFGDSVDDGDDDDELSRAWACLAADECLQQRVFTSACGHLNVLISRERKSLEVSHSLNELELC